MGPGLQILPSIQGSQADPVREKMNLWKDATNSDFSPPPRLPAKEARQLLTWFSYRTTYNCEHQETPL